MGWIITFGVLMLLAIIPLGASVRYDAEGILVRLIAGPVRITMLPRPEKKKKPDAPKPREKVQSEPTPPEEKKQNVPPEENESPAESKKKQEAGGKWTDFLPLVRVGLDLLNAFRRKLRVDELKLKLILAGDDPCDLALNYVRAWTALGNLLPRLERVFVIKKRDLEVECDFTADQTRVIVRLDLTITLGRLLALGVVYGFRALTEFLKIRRKEKAVQ